MHTTPALAFSIILPCYNEEGCIAETVKTLSSTFSTTEPYEIIVVNDGSTDGSQRILDQLAQENARLRVIVHPHNRGYGAALKTGIRHARAELIAITDADGTYPIERLPELVASCATQDMVVGARTAKGVAYSKIRAIPKFVLQRWVSWLAGRDVPDINSGMRVFRKSRVEEHFGILPDGFSFTITITLAMLTNYRPTLFVPISYKTRTGRSKIRPISDTLRFMLIILRTGTYFAPLRTFSPLIVLLFVSALISFAYDVLILENLTDKTILLFLFALNVGLFTLLADMIVRRTGR